MFPFIIGKQAENDGSDPNEGFTRSKFESLINALLSEIYER